MALSTLKGIRAIPDPAQSGYVSSSSLMDAVAEKVAIVFQVLTAGTITKIHFRTSTVTTGDTIKASIQGVDASGNPDGSVAKSGTVAVADGDDSVWKVVDFGAGNGAAVAAGSWHSAVIEYNSRVSGNLSISSTQPILTQCNLYGDFHTAAWTKQTTYVYAILLEYSDGTFAPNLPAGFGTVTTVSVDASTTPDEAGNYFQLPYKARAVGFWIHADLDADVTLKLFSSDNTLLATQSIDTDARNITTVGLLYVAFNGDPANVTLEADTWYRVVVLPGASVVTVRSMDFPSAAVLGAHDLGTNCHRTERTDAGAWTQTTTARIAIGLLIDQMEVGTSTGGGLPILGGSVVR
jgi:hypothetical protein